MESGTYSTSGPTGESHLCHTIIKVKSSDSDSDASPQTSRVSALSVGRGEIKKSIGVLIHELKNIFGSFIGHS